MTARRQPHRAPKRPRICRAICDARLARGLSQHDLARLVGVSQSMVARWETTREPSLEMIAVIETRLGLKAGQLLRAAGYVNGAGASVLHAVRDDDRLDEHGRRALLAAYRELAKVRR